MQIIKTWNNKKSLEKIRLNQRKSIGNNRWVKFTHIIHKQFWFNLILKGIPYQIKKDKILKQEIHPKINKKGLILQKIWTKKLIIVELNNNKIPSH